MDEEKIKIALYRRECIQKGYIEEFPKQGFPTSIQAIHSYISNIFCYIEINQKSTLITRLNTVYGCNCEERLKRLRLDQPLKRAKNLLPDSTFNQIEE